MKHWLFYFFICVGVHGWGQSDTLFEENPRKAVDKILGNLDKNIYGHALANRCLEQSQEFSDQLNNNYSQIHDFVKYFYMYTSLSWCYDDSTYLYNVQKHTSVYDSIMTTIERYSLPESDELFLPFGFLYHSISNIKPEFMENSNWYSIVNQQLVPTISQEQLYESKIIKSCSILDMYPDNGYKEGYLVYTPEMISHSPDISNLHLRINLGNGFQDFNAINNKIVYDRLLDSTIGYLAIDFTKNDTIFHDTLTFYITTNIDEKILEKSTNWDYTSTWTATNGLEIKYGGLIGCGTGWKKFRRPIIIIPPYRPAIQPVAMVTYFNQFNIGGLLDELASRGYDVIFCKLNPGYESLEYSGDAIAEFIEWVNWKKWDDYPKEDWENVVMGFSMGGQISRYALKKLEKNHMDNGGKHHHTRLYVPFDSPHLGANIPMFSQSVYYDLRDLNPFASASYNSLIDGASKDMGAYNISNSNLTPGGGNNYYIYPAPANERLNFIGALENDFNHQFTPLTDMRRSFPTFTRNIAITTGRNDQNYTDEFGLNPGELIFEQTLFPGLPPAVFKTRKVRSSSYGLSTPSFRNLELFTLFGIPIPIRNRDYRVEYGYEFDMAQGGYKDEFWDKNVTGVDFILKSSTFGLGLQNYKRHMCFLPLVSALAINPSIWQNNNLFYNTKTQGLMYKTYSDFIDINPSNTFGYPNLGLNSNHFNVTPFEAVYADPQTYEHIKMQASVEFPGDNLDANYLTEIKNFIADEVEASNVFMQNRIIGDNHVQGVSWYKYEAWYKAQNTMTFGKDVTPKTDFGNFEIKSTGDVVAYAGQEINLKPGVHFHNGSDVHLYIDYECYPSGGKNAMNDEPKEKEKSLLKQSNSTVIQIRNNEIHSNLISVYPNPSSGTIYIEVNENVINSDFEIVNLFGNVVHLGKIEQKTTQINLKSGSYLLRLIGINETFKIIVL